MTMLMSVSKAKGKALLIFTFQLSIIFAGFAGEYTYNSHPITTRTYKKLFKRFKTKLFVLSDGKVICPVDPSGKAKKISFSKKQLDRGVISGHVLKIIDKNTFTLKIKEMVAAPNYSSALIMKRNGTVTRAPVAKYHTVAICGADTSNLFAGEKVNARVISNGAYVDKLSQQRLRKFDMLNPITEPEFKKYLNAGNKLYTYIKRLSGYAKCEKCSGKGHLPNPKNQNRRKGKMKEPDLNCPDCKYGKNPVYKYTKILVKTKRKKIASR